MMRRDMLLSSRAEAAGQRRVELAAVEGHLLVGRVASGVEGQVSAEHREEYNADGRRPEASSWSALAAVLVKSNR